MHLLIALLAIAIGVQTGEAELPVSVARIRAQLEQSPGLQIALPELPSPTFRVEVRGKRYWTDDPLIPNFTVPPMAPLLPPRTFGDPAIGAVGGGGVDPFSAFAAARRAIQKRAARREVEKALAEFCAIYRCSEP